MTVDWSPCRCGRTSPRFAGRIARYGGGDAEGVTCAASSGALSEALGSLNAELV
ncbi:hypothetical protein NKH77_17770 [Streptomyces sp. M19]